MSTIQHGTRTCYVKRKCRRPECRAANAEYKRNKVADNKALILGTSEAFLIAGLDEALPQLTHGLPSTYEWWGCRCPDCTEAKRSRDSDYRQRRAERLKGVA